MWKRRVGWILLVAAGGILYLFDNAPATLALPGVLFIVPVFLGLLLLPAREKIEVAVIVRGKGRKQACMTGQIRIKNKGWLPLSYVEVRILGHNARTGEETELFLKTGVGIRQETELSFSFASEHCGRLIFTAQEVMLRDAFGLFAVRKSCSTSASVTVLPELFETVAVLSSSASAMLEGEQYSGSRTGNDPGETLGIREYIPGDPVKNMHWKLSQKMDKLLIRELGMPIVSQVMVLFETAADAQAAPGQLDAAAEVFASVVYALYRQEIVPWIGWRDTETGIFFTREIASETAFQDGLLAVMALGPASEDTSVIEDFLRQQGRAAYAHMVVVGVRPDVKLAGAVNGTTATVLSLGQETGAGGVRADGTLVILFTETGYREELSRLDL